MTGPHPIAVPVEVVTATADWARQVRERWPQAPAWFVVGLAVLLRNRNTDADMLLILADALEQARGEANIEGQVYAANGLARVADLVRRLAPHRIKE